MMSTIILARACFIATFSCSFAFALLLGSQRASAEIMVLDSEFGSGTITRDTVNNLDWLDWTLTTNRTYWGVTPPYYQGWRLATLSECQSLFESAGAVGSQYQNYDRLQAALGTTATWTIDSKLWCLSWARVADTLSGLHGTVKLYVIKSLTGVESGSGDFDGEWVVDYEADPGLGAALVRPSPEPSTLALLGVGAASLLLYAWRRRNRAA